MNNESRTNRGLAITAFVLGVATVVVGIVSLIIIGSQVAAGAGGFAIMGWGPCSRSSASSARSRWWRA